MVEKTKINGSSVRTESIANSCPNETVEDTSDKMDMEVDKPVMDVKSDEDFRSEALSKFLDEDVVDSRESTFGRGTLFETESGDEYLVFDDLDEAEIEAEDRVVEDLKENPDLFDQDFLDNHLVMSDTTKRVIANDFADFDTEDIDDPNEADEQRDIRFEEIMDELNSDPLNFFIDQGFERNDAIDKYFDIDYREASKEAVRVDGIAHFLAPYDGEETSLEGDFVAFRVN